MRAAGTCTRTDYKMILKRQFMINAPKQLTRYANTDGLHFRPKLDYLKNSFESHRQNNLVTSIHGPLVISNFEYLQTDFCPHKRLRSLPAVE